MEKFVYFPTKEFEFSLKKSLPFFFENQQYKSIDEYIRGNSKEKSFKGIPECNEYNIQRAEKGLMEMLKQHKQLRDCILKTNEHSLAYAMAVDGDWGIGFKPNEPQAFNKNNWKGKNILGEILARVRKHFKENPKLYFNQNQETKSNSKEVYEHSYDWREISKNLKEKYTFFWRADSPFSQHHPTKFTLDGQIFNCAEQYYMYMKAVTFKDNKSKWQILETEDPMKQKSIGRKVYNFDAGYWDTIAQDVVFKGNIAKFSQNSRLLKLLLMTEGTSMVEASPKDDKWGVNLEAHDVRIFQKHTWKGTNWLGNTLTKVRQHFFNNGTKSDYTFDYLKPDCYISFSKSASPYHYTHMCFFEVDGVPYSSLNHYLVHMAAELFNDVKVISEVKSCMCNSKLDQLFSKIHKFNPVEFNIHLTKYLLIGNYHKFTQNQNILCQLLDTSGCVLVFKDSDQSLGNGNNSFEETEIMNDSWNGKNLLGYTLSYLRDQYLISEGKYRPSETYDFSIYRIHSVSYFKSQNYRKKCEANKLIHPNNNYESLPQCNYIQPERGANIYSSRGGGQPFYNKNYNKDYQNQSNYAQQGDNSETNMHDTKRAKKKKVPTATLR